MNTKAAQRANITTLLIRNGKYDDHNLETRQELHSPEMVQQNKRANRGTTRVVLFSPAQEGGI
jgi:ribonucleotide monophosphatase NagD (HAD superfamily)